MGLPWPQKPLQKESETLSNELLALEQPAAIPVASAIPTVRLPSTSLPKKGALPASEPVSPDVYSSQLAAHNSPPEPTFQTQDAQEVVQPIEQTTEQPIQPQPVQPQPMPQATEPTDPLSSPSQSLEPVATETHALSAPLSPSAPNAPLGGEPEYGKVMPLGEAFPHLAGAQPGCYGLEGCRQLSGNYRKAAQQLIDQLEAQGFELTEREDIENTGHRVFEAIAPNEPDKRYYLNVFSPDAGSTVYVMTVEILSLEALQKLSS